MGSHRRMSLDLAALGSGELGGFIDDVMERSIDLANVVKERDALDAMLSSLVEVCRFGDYQRVLRNAPHVRAGRRVIRVDRVEERLQRGRSETLKSESCPSLAGEQGSGGNRSDYERSVSNHASALGKNRTSNDGWYISE